MSWLRFFRRKREDADLMREIEGYLAQEIAINKLRGMTEEEANRRAQIKCGNTVGLRESPGGGPFTHIETRRS